MPNPLASLSAVVKPKPHEVAAEKKERKAEQKEAKQALASAATPLTMDEKLKALTAVRNKLNAQFETTNSVVSLGSKIGSPLPHMPTGIVSLDMGVLRTGGVLEGRIMEIYGPESSGKTTLALEIVAEDQKRGNLAAFVDAEHALDPNYAAAIGVDVKNLQVSQPDSGEQALETVQALVESRAVSTIVIDSVAALVPQAELDGEMGDSHMGLQARLMSQACRKLRGIAHINNVKLIFINQIREKVGVIYGNPEVTTGGKALKFYASVRLDVRRISSKDGLHHMKIKAVKNKGAAPFGETEVVLIPGKGIDRFYDLISYAKELGVFEVSGAWLSFQGERLANGVDNAVELLRTQPETFERLRVAVKDKLAQIGAEEITA